jgi:hypothetical protein
MAIKKTAKKTAKPKKKTYEQLEAELAATKEALATAEEQISYMRLHWRKPKAV